MKALTRMAGFRETKLRIIKLALTLALWTIFEMCWSNFKLLSMVNQNIKHQTWTPYTNLSNSNSNIWVQTHRQLAIKHYKTLLIGIVKSDDVTTVYAITAAASESVVTVSFCQRHVQHSISRDADRCRCCCRSSIACTTADDPSVWTCLGPRWMLS